MVATARFDLCRFGAADDRGLRESTGLARKTRMTFVKRL
jgi:hypothetical protein